MGLEYDDLRHRLAEEMAASEQLRQERVRNQEFMQHVNRLVNQVWNQHRATATGVPLATFMTVADQVRLAAAIIGHVKPGDDAGI
jgi:hypothetical protein